MEILKIAFRGQNAEAAQGEVKLTVTWTNIVVAMCLLIWVTLVSGDPDLLDGIIKFITA